MLPLDVFLREEGIFHRFHEKQETIHTKDAAEHTGIPLNQIVKTLVLESDSGPMIAIIPGDQRLDLSVAKRVLGAKKLALAPFDKTEELVGYRPGAVPPVNHKEKLSMVFDEKLLKHETVFGAGGARNYLVELIPSDITRLNEARIAPITVNQQLE